MTLVLAVLFVFQIISLHSCACHKSPAFNYVFSGVQNVFLHCATTEVDNTFKTVVCFAYIREYVNISSRHGPSVHVEYGLSLSVVKIGENALYNMVHRCPLFKKSWSKCSSQHAFEMTGENVMVQNGPSLSLE